MDETSRAAGEPLLCPSAQTTIRYQAGRLVGRYGFTEGDRGDIEQELALDLLGRLRHFDPARAKRCTFIARCIEHRIANLIRDRRRARRDPRRLCRIAEEGERSGSAVSASSLLDRHADPERERTDMRFDIADAIARLPPRLQAICALLPAHTPFAISRRLGLSKRVVYRDVAAIREAFAAAGLEVYRS